MRITIKRIKTPKVKTMRRVKKSRLAFRMPKLNMPSLRLSEAHFVVLVLAVVAAVSVVGMFFMQSAATNSTSAVVYSPMCEQVCGADEVPVGFTAYGSGQVECLCKKV